MSDEIIKSRELFLKENFPNWCDHLNDREIRSFIMWASECRIYGMGDDKGICKGNTGDALRGFVKGIEFSKSHPRVESYFHEGVILFKTTDSGRK